LLRFFAQESVRQCGPCTHGTAAMAGTLKRCVAGAAAPADLERLRRRAEVMLPRRGACGHLYGAARAARPPAEEAALAELRPAAREGVEVGDQVRKLRVADLVRSIDRHAAPAAADRGLGFTPAGAQRQLAGGVAPGAVAILATLGEIDGRSALGRRAVRVYGGQ